MPAFSNLVFGICLAGLFVLGGCTSTTTVRPNNLALQQSESAQGGSLRDMAVPDLLNAGNALLAEGKLEMARLYFLAAIGREPQNALPYVGLGNIDMRIGTFKTALANYQKASTLDSQNLAATLGQIQILRDQGDLNAAHEQLSHAMQIAPNDVKVLTELAITYNLQGQETLAEPLFKEVASKAPDSAATFNNIGVNELSQGNYAFAIVNLSKAFMLDDKNEKITNNLAMAFALYGQENQAMKLYSRTVGEAAAWNNIGYLYMTQRRFDDAGRDLHKAQELNPKYYLKAQKNLERLERMRTNEKSLVNEKRNAQTREQ